MANEHLETASSALPVVTTSPKYCDVTLVCQGAEFQAHRCVLCPRSPVLSAICDKQAKGTISLVIQVDGFDAATVGRLLKYIYQGNYDSGDGKERHERMINNVEVFVIADYYQVLDLKDVALEKIMSSIEDFWTLNGFAGLVGAIYKRTTRSSGRDLREYAALVAAEHVSQLMDDASFSKLFYECSDFALELTKVFADISKPMSNEEADSDPRKKEQETIRLRDDLAKSSQRCNQLQEELATANNKYLEAVRRSQELEAGWNESKQRLSAALEGAQTGRHTAVQLCDSLQTELGKTTSSLQVANQRCQTLSAELARAKSDTQSANERNRRLQDDLNAANRSMSSAVVRRDEAYDNFRDHVIECLDAAGDIQECRHCHEELNTWLEVLDDDEILLRCTHCRTRHYL